MLTEALLAAAAAGGKAVAAAMGTEAWQTVRRRVAALFGTDRTALHDLEKDAARVESGDLRDADTETALRTELSRQWRARFETLLKELDPAGRAQVSDELHALAATVEGQGVFTHVARNHGTVIGRDNIVSAPGGGTAVGENHGGITINPPPRPGRNNG